MFHQVKELREYIALYHEIDNFFHEIALKIGISDSAFFVFYTLLEIGEGCLQKDICEVNMISKQTIHSAIRKLEKEEMLYIEQGKKEKRIYLTEKGKIFVDQKILPIAIKENEVFEEMSELERQEIVRITKKYLTHFQEKVSLNDYSTI